MRTITTFKNLSITEKGIELELANNSNHTIFFSEIERIYLKKYQFNILVKALFISFPFVLIPLSITYFPLEAIPTITFFMFLLLVSKIHLHKWYKIKIGLTDGTIYNKKVSNEMKNKSIELINKTKEKKFYYETRQHTGNVKNNGISFVKSNEIESKYEFENDNEKIYFSFGSLIID